MLLQNALQLLQPFPLKVIIDVLTGAITTSVVGIILKPTAVILFAGILAILLQGKRPPSTTAEVA